MWVLMLRMRNLGAFLRQAWSFVICPCWKVIGELRSRLMLIYSGIKWLALRGLIRDV
ncbi:hypothetical protein THIOM_003584 [Candidatus Thiomargarita nelsonii]|uniref:Uncharacterized protein n=1 Tax=Candidatus Thiomargarita nelsonii TaxID=1003181 RepID=A0A176RY34_9GAMM|nr:hypothetical protein THIOM_003584 [Candidatus Thiomargarita nelsonii]